MERRRLGCVNSPSWPEGAKRRDSRNLAFIFSCISVRSTTISRYVHCLTGKTHLDIPEEEKRRIRLEKGENIDPNQGWFNQSKSDLGRISSNIHTFTKFHQI